MINTPFKHPIITITGDICVDWLRFPVKPKDSGLNWELHPGIRMIARPGGALLLSEFLRRSTDAVVFSPELEDIEKIPSEKVLHSNVELNLFPFSSDPKEKNKPVYRVRHFLGFTGPVTGAPALLHVKNDNPDADIVILDDVGNGFREKKEYWPKAILEDGKKPASDPSMQPWDELSDNLKESNRRQADHIPEKLRRVGCGFAPVVDREPAIFEFTPQEVEIMAEMEHERWVSERLLDGWVYGEKRDVEKKINPYLVPWNSLADEVKEFDRQAMRGLSEFLAKPKFEIYHMH